MPHSPIFFGLPPKNNSKIYLKKLSLPTISSFLLPTISSIQICKKILPSHHLFLLPTISCILFSSNPQLSFLCPTPSPSFPIFILTFSFPPSPSFSSPPNRQPPLLSPTPSPSLLRPLPPPFNHLKKNPTSLLYPTTSPSPSLLYPLPLHPPIIKNPISPLSFLDLTSNISFEALGGRGEEREKEGERRQKREKRKKLRRCGFGERGKGGSNRENMGKEGERECKRGGEVEDYDEKRMEMVGRREEMVGGVEQCYRRRWAD